MARIHGKMKWRWFLQTLPSPPPNSGVSDSLDAAKAALVKRYEEVKRGIDGSRRRQAFQAMAPRLTPQRRRALKLLASSRDGVNAGLLVFVHGFDRRVLDCLVKAGFAAAEREVVVAAGKPVEIIRISITNAGRRAIGE
jgi:hypothetical protein